MALTPYTPTTWVNDSEPDLEADNLNKIEQGIASAIDGVNGILDALTNQLSTDQTKFAGIAVVNTLNTTLNTLSNTVSTLNSNLTALKNKSPSDLAYISALLPRISDIIGTGQSINLLNDITYMINTKGIQSGCFGYSNIVYTDKPSGVTDWGFVEYFKHADAFVTVKIYPENNTDFYVGRFTLGQSTWSTTWKKVQYST